MYVKVVSGSVVLIDQEVRADKFTIGRGSKADIKLDSIHLSRQHLLVEVESDQVLIKNLSKSNWTSINNEKISSENFTPIFDFSEVQLPGGLELSIKKSVEKQDLIHTRTTTNLNKVDRKKVKKEKVTISTQDKNRIVLAIFGSLAMVAGGLYYFLSTKVEKAAPAPKISKVVNKSVKVKKSQSIDSSFVRPLEKEQVEVLKVEYNSSRNNIALMIDKEKCSGEAKFFCAKFFGQDLLEEEGVLIEDDTIYFYLNYSLRMKRLLRMAKFQFHKNLTLDDIAAMVAAKKLLSPSLFQEIQKAELAKGYIIVHQGSNEIAVYGIKPSFKVNLSTAQVNSAIRTALKHGQTRFLYRFLTAYLPQVRSYRPKK